MAKVMEEKGNFENLNDEFSNSNITEKFYKLYDNDWVYLSRRLGKLGVSLTELELIHHLTQMMKVIVIIVSPLKMQSEHIGYYS
jgi:hypothetical protein